ncbi:hypothetical protein Sango_0436600 [Sesamum angolense]|uniref:Uncharacterized protein n=1 Tax=Sesamum angolense TaxID=2727404 RepID=A0AAE1XBK8_9LAMI|nr:hypothetical protein Sango_0436600 [Sesamum angolense]
MASTCISSCVDDARVPVRATYVNLYKWPESDFEFVRSMSSKARKDGQNPCTAIPGGEREAGGRWLEKEKSATDGGGEVRGAEEESVSALLCLGLHFPAAAVCTTKIDVVN